jgi:hypothetical protein
MASLGFLLFTFAGNNCLHFKNDSKDKVT